MDEEEKKEGIEEDILTKLTMPGHSLREETKAKMKEAVEKHGEGAQRLGIVENVVPTGEGKEEAKAKTEEQIEGDILTKLTMPGQTSAVAKGEEKKEGPVSGLAQDVDKGQVEKLAENIFNSDFGEKKKKV